MGIAVAQWLRCCARNRKVLVRSQLVSLEFQIALWPCGSLSLQQKWVPGAFPGDKCGRCVRLTTLPPSCAVVVKSGNLNFLEPSGPLQACKGTALPFTFKRQGTSEFRSQLVFAEWGVVVGRVVYHAGFSSRKIGISFAVSGGTSDDRAGVFFSAELLRFSPATRHSTYTSYSSFIRGWHDVSSWGRK